MGRRALVLACGAICGLGAGLPAAVQAQLPEYTLEPTVRIGSLDDPKTALSVVSILASAPDGRIAVAQPAETNVWVFSPTGERLAVVGGAGDGPGEFQAISALGWRGDTLWVGDGRRLRVTFVVPEEGAPRLVGGPERHAEAVIRVPLPGEDGLWLLQRRWPLDPNVRWYYRDEIWSGDEDWQPLERLAGLPEGPDAFEIDLSGPRPSRQLHPIGQHPLFAIAPDASSVTIVRRDLAGARGGQGRYTATRIGLDGDTVFHREHGVELEPFERGTRDAVVEDFVSREDLQRAFASTAALQRAVLAGLDVPEFHPPVSKAVVGSDGSTWLRGPDDRSGTVRWVVLDRAGQPVRTVVSGREIGMFQWLIETQDIVVMTVDEGGVWAVVNDELDVPYVVRYELRPTAGNGAAGRGDREPLR